MNKRQKELIQKTQESILFYYKLSKKKESDVFIQAYVDGMRKLEFLAKYLNCSEEELLIKAGVKNE